MGAEILTVNSVTKCFGALAAVDDVSFAVSDGEILGVAGPNGAGKTTLFNVISVVPFHADSGTVEFLGAEIQGLPAHAVCQRGLARTFQKEAEFSSLDVLRNVMIGSEFGHAKRRPGAAREAAKTALELVGYEGRLDTNARRLSLLDKKRVMIASALATEPRLLMLDEPASGLSEGEVAEMARLILAIQRLGVSILLIEHVLTLLLEVSHRIMIMANGSKLVEGPPQSVIEDERVIEAYLGKGGGHHGAAA